MPLSYNNRSYNSAGNSLLTPIITNNPAFSVQIIPVDGRLEQKPNVKSGDAQFMAIKIGDIIRGKEMSGSDQTTPDIIGRVTHIEEDSNGEILHYVVLSKEGKEVDIDPSTAQEHYDNGEPNPNVAPAMSGGTTPASSRAYENRLMNFAEWLSESNQS